MNLGERLREEREKKGWTQLHAAKVFGITNGALSNYERNYREPDAEFLNKFASVYNVSIDYLLGRTDYPSVTHELGTLGADRYIKKHGIHKLSEITSDNDIEVEREVQAFHEKGITIDRATAQKIVEHRGRILAGEEGSIDYIYQAETLGDALLRIAELDYEYDFDEETFAKLVIKAREKYGLPSVKGAEPVAHSTNYSGTSFKEDAPSDNCVHENEGKYNINQNYEEHVLSAGTLADASIEIANLLNTHRIDGEEYLRLNTLAYEKFGLPPAPGAEQAAHTEQNIPGTGVFEEDTKKR